MSAPHKIRIEFDEIYRETYKAYWIVIGDKRYWLPKSQIIMFEKQGVIFMQERLAKEKGLVECLKWPYTKSI